MPKKNNKVGRPPKIIGYVRAPYTEEHLELLRKIAGEACNINQIAKHLNEGQGSYKLYAIAMVEKLTKILDDSKKH